MKKKAYTRPVSVVLSDDMFEKVKAIADQAEISISEYIREAVQEKLSDDSQKTSYL